MKAKQGLGERVKLVVLTLCDGFHGTVISFFTGMMIMSLSLCSDRGRGIEMKAERKTDRTANADAAGDLRIKRGRPVTGKSDDKMLTPKTFLATCIKRSKPATGSGATITQLAKDFDLSELEVTRELFAICVM